MPMNPLQFDRLRRTMLPLLFLVSLVAATTDPLIGIPASKLSCCIVSIAPSSQLRAPPLAHHVRTGAPIRLTLHGGGDRGGDAAFRFPAGGAAADAAEMRREIAHLRDFRAARAVLTERRAGARRLAALRDSAEKKVQRRQRRRRRTICCHVMRQCLCEGPELPCAGQVSLSVRAQGSCVRHGAKRCATKGVRVNAGRAPLFSTSLPQELAADPALLPSSLLHAKLAGHTRTT
jgi:hypothetical protein